MIIILTHVRSCACVVRSYGDLQRISSQKNGKNAADRPIGTSRKHTHTCDPPKMNVIIVRMRRFSPSTLHFRPSIRIHLAAWLQWATAETLPHICSNNSQLYYYILRWRAFRWTGKPKRRDASRFSVTTSLIWLILIGGKNRTQWNEKIMQKPKTIELPKHLYRVVLCVCL